MAFNLGSFFGAGPQISNPYAAQQGAAAAGVAGAGQNLNNFGQTQLAGYNVAQPQYLQAVKNESNILTSDPYTDSYSTGKIAQATNTTTAAYQAAKASLAQDMARRGIAGGSADIGGNSAIDAAAAGQVSSAANNVAQDAINQRNVNAAANTQLLGGVADADRTGFTGAESGAAGADATAGGIYGNLGAQSIQAQQDNNQNSDVLGNLFGAGIGAIAGGYGAALGKSIGTPKPKAPATAGGTF